MRPNLFKRIGGRAAVLAGIGLAATLITSRAQADQWDKTTLITIDQPIQVWNTYLEPGTYMFKLMESSSDRHIVQIFTKDRSRLINTILAMPSYRLDPTGRTQFTFWETPPGTAKAVRMWYYPGDNYGQEFRYPTNLRQVALAVPHAPAPQPVATQAPIVTPPAPVTHPEAQATQPEQETVIIAQNNAPENNAQAIAQNQPAPEPASDASNQAGQQNLPSTASPYPSIGLGGLLTLGLLGLLRTRPIA